jgi:glycosyltransferase involved in cell wall biosynthesis
MKQPHILVYTSGYNAASWAADCIQSVRRQTYKNWHHIVVDDSSTDKTGDIIRQGDTGRMKIYKTYKNIKWLRAAMSFLHPDDDDIVVTLDMDDWLSSDAVLQTVVEIYAKHDCWLTYGDYVRASNPFALYSGHCRPYRQEVLDRRLFRNEPFMASHLRTFKGFLWNNLNHDDFRIWDGTIADMAYDCAIMYPMLEMCKPGKIICIQRPLYVYNDHNPLNDHKIDRLLQVRTDEWFKARPVYPVLGSRT